MVNIYAGREWGWDTAEHIAHGKGPGDDMVTTRGERILAPVSGTVTRTTHSCTITEPDGWRTVALELASSIVQSTVDAGHAIGYAGELWTHWHSITPEGVRVPARFLTPTKGVIEMLGLNYNVPGAKNGTKVLYDPIAKLVTPPLSTVEQSVFTQSGGVFVNVNELMWTQLLGGCREVKKPDPAGGAAPTGPFTFTGTATPTQ